MQGLPVDEPREPARAEDPRERHRARPQRHRRVLHPRQLGVPPEQRGDAREPQLHEAGRAARDQRADVRGEPAVRGRVSDGGGRACGAVLRARVRTFLSSFFWLTLRPTPRVQEHRDRGQRQLRVDLRHVQHAHVRTAPNPNCDLWGETRSSNGIQRSAMNRDEVAPFDAIFFTTRYGRKPSP